MMQVRNTGILAQTLDAIMHASMICTSDASKLKAFVQQAQNARDEDDDQASGAQAGNVYASQNGSIVDTLQDLTEKAESQLADLRLKEVATRHNFEVLKQSLVDEIRFGINDMEVAKASIAESTEHKATTKVIWL